MKSTTRVSALLIQSLLLAVIPMTAMAQEWRATTLWMATEGIQGVRFGDADPRRPGVEAVGVTRDGAVGIAGFHDGRIWSDTIYRHGAQMTGLFIADIDPEAPGNEIYIGGGRTAKAKGGEVIQIALIKGQWRARQVWEAPDVVHVFDTIPRRTGQRNPILVAPTYAGTVHFLFPTTSGLWRDSLIFQHVATGADANDLVIKDLRYGELSDQKRTVSFATKGGDLVVVDLDDPTRSGRIYRHSGGIARFTLDPDGSIYGSCNDGCLVHVHRVNGSWRGDTLFRDYQEGRGVVVGRFPFAGQTCPLATFSYSHNCRLFYNNGIGWDTRTVFRDIARAHWMVAADVIPGNDADEILLGGYSGRMTLLSRQKSRDR